MKKTLSIGFLVFLAALPAAAQQGRWTMGFNLISVSTNAESSPGEQSGSYLSIGDGIGFGIEGTYMFTGELAVELSLSTSERDLDAHDGEYDGETAGTFWVMPLTVTAKWYFPLYGRFSPYVGAGITYSFSHGHERSDAFEDTGLNKIEIKGDIGLALQAGVDYDLGETWFATIDLKYLDCSGELELRFPNDSLYDRLDLDGQQFQIELGFGYRF
jgi:outer membrane protein